MRMQGQVADAGQVDNDASREPGVLDLPIGNDLGFLLAKLHAAGSVLNNAALADLGLKERSFSVLALACWEHQPTQRELAVHLSLDPSQIVALIDELEAKRLVARRPGTADRRHKIVTPTAKGREVYAAAREATWEAEASQLSGLSAGEAETLKSLLRKALQGPKTAGRPD